MAFTYNVIRKGGNIYALSRESTGMFNSGHRSTYNTVADPASIGLVVSLRYSINYHRTKIEKMLGGSI